MSVNYESIAADCDIIAQKIESLRLTLKTYDTSDLAQDIEDKLLVAIKAIQDAKSLAEDK